MRVLYPVEEEGVIKRKPLYFIMYYTDDSINEKKNVEALFWSALMQIVLTPGLPCEHAERRCQSQEVIYVGRPDNTARLY